MILIFIMSTHSKALTGLLTWERVDELIGKIRSLGPWYIHSPADGMESLFTAGGSEAADFLTGRSEEIKARKHGAGWVYVHTPEAPSWIKIYDPMKCGSSCSMTTPNAWWEMDLEDPREKISCEEPAAEKGGLMSWLRSSKTDP
jgi:hypothetical protein